MSTIKGVLLLLAIVGGSLVLTNITIMLIPLH